MVIVVLPAMLAVELPVEEAPLVVDELLMVWEQLAVGFRLACPLLVPILLLSA